MIRMRISSRAVLTFSVSFMRHAPQIERPSWGTIYLTKRIPYIWCTGQLKRCILQNIVSASSSTLSPLLAQYVTSNVALSSGRVRHRSYMRGLEANPSGMRPDHPSDGYDAVEVCVSLHLTCS